MDFPYTKDKTDAFGCGLLLGVAGILFALWLVWFVAKPVEGKGVEVAPSPSPTPAPSLGRDHSWETIVWETIVDDRMDWVQRLEVPGGWLYHTHNTIAFVPSSSAVR